MQLLRWGALLVAFGATAFGIRDDGGAIDYRDLPSSNAKTKFEIPLYSELKDWESRRAAIQQQILVAAGLDVLGPRPPVRARRFGRIAADGYVIEKVQINTGADLLLGANLYLPATLKGKAPGILLPHGHWKHGRIHHASDYSVPALGALLARNGYVVLAYDMLGYNDTRQLPHKFGDTRREMLWGFSSLGIHLQNSIRGVDFMQSLPEVDRLRIGVTGTSGGGTQTLLLTAVDPRIKAAAPAGMVSSTFQGDDNCEEAPGLHVGLSNVEIAAAAAPRPLLLVSATGDWTKHTPEVELPAIRAIYQLYDKADLVSNRHIDAGHNCNVECRAAVLQFFDQHLAGGRNSKAPEPDLSSMDLNDLLIHAEEREAFEEMFTAFRRQAMRRYVGTDAERMRQRLRALLGLPAEKDKIRVLPEGADLVVESVSDGERVQLAWNPAAAKGIAVVVHSDGPKAALESETAKSFLARGIAVAAPRLYQPALPNEPDHLHELAYRRSVDTNRVRDLLHTLRFAAMQPRKGGVSLVCLGDAKPYCLAAAAATFEDLVFDVSMHGMPNDEAVVAKRLFIPGLQRIGGVPLLTRLAKLR